MAPVNRSLEQCRKSGAKAAPLHGGIAVRKAAIEEFPVLEEEKRVNHEVGNILEPAVNSLRKSSDK
jgi:hypothetical protein